MALKPKSQIRDVRGISDEQKARIHDFLQGAVYCWCKNRKDEWFSLRDLMGGDNTRWGGTPLQPLWQKQIDAGVSGAAAGEQAGKEAGWLLKHVIADDPRAFETRQQHLIREYRWKQRAQPRLSNK